MSRTTFRATFTLPSDLAVMLSNVSKRLGCSQSAVLSVLLGDALPYVAAGLASDVPEGTVPRRLVGDSAGDVCDRVRAAMVEGKSYGQGSFDLRAAGL